MHCPLSQLSRMKISKQVEKTKKNIKEMVELKKNCTFAVRNSFFKG